MSIAVIKLTTSIVTEARGFEIDVTGGFSGPSRSGRAGGRWISLKSV